MTSPIFLQSSFKKSLLKNLKCKNGHKCNNCEKIQSHKCKILLVINVKTNRPVARYGLPPPPRHRGNFVDQDFLEASCLASFLQHVSPLAMVALPSNSPLHMLPIQRHKFNIKRTEVRIHVNICRRSIKIYFI